MIDKRNRHAASRRQNGLTGASGVTLIEILVAIALLGIIGSAIIGSFALTITVNREASADVDYGRVVRTMTDKIVGDWRQIDQWNGAFVGGNTLAEYVNVASVLEPVVVDPTNPWEFDGVCVGSYDPVGDDTAVRRTVTITCQGQEGGRPQVYVFEVGSPRQ